MPKRTEKVSPDEWNVNENRRKILERVRGEVRAAMEDEPYVVDIKVGRLVVATITGSGRKTYAPRSHEFERED